MRTASDAVRIRFAPGALLPVGSRTGSPRGHETAKVETPARLPTIGVGLERVAACPPLPPGSTDRGTAGGSARRGTAMKRFVDLCGLVLLAAAVTSIAPD